MQVLHGNGWNSQSLHVTEPECRRLDVTGRTGEENSSIHAIPRQADAFGVQSIDTRFNTNPGDHRSRFPPTRRGRGVSRVYRRVQLESTLGPSTQGIAKIISPQGRKKTLASKISHDDRPLAKSSCHLSYAIEPMMCVSPLYDIFLMLYALPMTGIKFIRRKCSSVLSCSLWTCYLPALTPFACCRRLLQVAPPAPITPPVNGSTAYSSTNLRIMEQSTVQGAY